ncbi:MAG: glycosyltransferase [Candidatus Omnitrophota bacterium]
MGKINILHAIEGLGVGGAERLLTTNLSYLNKDRFNNIVTYLNNEDYFLRDLARFQIKVYPIHVKNIYSPIKVIKRLLNIIRKEKIDIIHTHLFSTNIYGRIAGGIARRPHIVTTLHGLDYEPYSIFRSRFFFERRRLLDSFTGRLFNDSFIAVSSAVKKSAEGILGFKNIGVVHNSIDLDRFKALTEKERLDTRQRLSLSKDDIVLVTVGRLDIQKGHTFLIRALKESKLENKNIKLLIVGKGILENELKSEVKSLKLEKNIIFLKDRDDIREVVGCSDIFILPSIYSEGFGIVLLEAMALKIPCIASDIDGIKEIITNEKEGVLVKPSSCRALSDAIADLIENPFKKSDIAESGYLKVKRDFDIRQQIRQLEEIYMSFNRK